MAFFAKQGSSLDRAGTSGETCLTIAVKLGDARSLEAFLLEGASPHVANAKGEYPIFLAMDRRDEKCVDMLLLAGVPLSAQKDGLSVADYARQCGMEEVADELTYLDEWERAVAISSAMAPLPVHIPSSVKSSLYKGSALRKK